MVFPLLVRILIFGINLVTFIIEMIGWIALVGAIHPIIINNFKPTTSALQRLESDDPYSSDPESRFGTFTERWHSRTLPVNRYG
jgi:hypothetical protein